MASYFGRSVNPVDNGSLSAATVTITPVASMVTGDLVLMMGLWRDSSAIAPIWPVAPLNGGGQDWVSVGGSLNGFGCSLRRYQCVFNGTWAVQNLLTANQASLETDTTGWAADTNCTIARTGAGGSVDGSFALQMTSSASGVMRAITPTGLSGIPVTPGKYYSVVAHFKAATVGRTCAVQIMWYDSAGAFISVHSGAITDGTSSFTKAALSGLASNVNFKAPSTAAFAAVQLQVGSTGGAGEIHYVDAISFGPGDYSGFFLPSASTDPVVGPEGVSSDTITGLMVVYRPSAQATGWKLDSETSSFLTDEDAPYDLTFPSQTLRENSSVAVVEWHRDASHVMEIQDLGWDEPNAETQWRNTAGNDLTLSLLHHFQNVGATGSVTNRADTGPAFFGATYMSFYEITPEFQSSRNIHSNKKALHRASRW